VQRDERPRAVHLGFGDRVHSGRQPQGAQRAKAVCSATVKLHISLRRKRRPPCTTANRRQRTTRAGRRMATQSAAPPWGQPPARMSAQWSGAPSTMQLSAPPSAAEPAKPSKRETVGPASTHPPRTLPHRSAPASQLADTTRGRSRSGASAGLPSPSHHRWWTRTDVAMEQRVNWNRMKRPCDVARAVRLNSRRSWVTLERAAASPAAQNAPSVQLLLRVSTVNIARS